jgi:hypothetical protein
MGIGAELYLKIEAIKSAARVQASDKSDGEKARAFMRLRGYLLDPRDPMSATAWLEKQRN